MGAPVPSLRSGRSAFRRIAWAAAFATYGLIVLGGVVRITGSGMGCGDHWPKCNGRWFPPLTDVATLIEWNHRLFAVVVTVLVTAVMVMAFVLRRRAKRCGEQGAVASAPGREAYMAFGLLETIVLLGAITVKLELPTWSVVLHFSVAMLLLATLIEAAMGRTGGPAVRRSDAVLILGAFLTVILGALVANTAANRACWGFPLCNGQIWPTTGAPALLQWIHRLAAYGLAGYAIWRAVKAPSPAAWALVAAILAQVVVAILMLAQFLPTSLRALHLAFGALVWAAAVWQPARDSRTPG